MRRVCVSICLIVGAVLTAQPVAAQQMDGCKELPSHAALKKALAAAQAESNGGLGFHMWGTVVDRDGIVCAVAFTGANRGEQWPGSRVISAQKANTANAFSHPKFALSTANLFSAVQPGQSLFGLQESNPVDTSVATVAQQPSSGAPMIRWRGSASAASMCSEEASRCTTRRGP